MISIIVFATKTNNVKIETMVVGNRPACSAFTGIFVSQRQAEWAGPFPTLYFDVFTIDHNRIKP